MSQGLAWLPDAALTPARVAAVLAAIIEAWSGTWLGGAALRLEPISFAPLSAAPEDAGATVGPSSALTATLNADTRRILAEHALGAVLTGQMIAPIDRRILDGVADFALGDLFKRLETVVTTAGREGNTLSFQVMVGHQPLLALHCDAGRLIGAIKSAIPSRRKSGGLSNRIGACGRQAVNVEGLLGTASVRVDAVNQLAIGDVLLLGASVDESALLRLAKGGPTVARGRLDVCGDYPAIRL